MTDQVLISVISGTTSICMAIITVVIKTWLDGKNAAKKAADDESIRSSDLGEMIYIHEFVENIREEFKFDRVGICQFHNGGKFLNGRSMKKFSMTYESTAPGIEKIKRNYQNVMVSEFPKMVAGLLDNDFFIVDHSNSTEYPQMWREMQTNGIVQSVKVPIRGLRGDIMGFITCHSVGEHNDMIGEYLRIDFVERANQISGYLLK